MVVSPQISAQDQQAQQLVDRFVRRFDPAYEWLLYYAALPLVLTPELLNYLRNKFLRDRSIPWVAEVDLLLSDIFKPVGDEQYAMDSTVRDYLVRQATEKLGQAELERVAKLLILYVEDRVQTNQYLTVQERRAQKWAAMVFVEAERGRVAEDIAAAFRDCEQVEVERVEGRSLASRAELLRLSRITQTLAPQLIGHEALVKYAQAVTAALSRPEHIDSGQLSQRFLVGDVALKLSDSLKPEQDTDFELETLEFFHGQLIDAEEDAQGDIADSFPPPLKTANFKIATISVEGQSAPAALHTFVFTVASLYPKDQQRSTGLRIHRQQRQANHFLEPFDNGLSLEIVAVPGGSFVMGSVRTEAEYSTSEVPQHRVTVPGFYMGRYPVTQAQWRFVANLPQVNGVLKIEPSLFSGDKRPVERVSWLDAKEFCDRLKDYTNRSYRLPTEAEWEYACRAGTTTPFHFGEALIPDVANYSGAGYQQSTPIDKFRIANAFGLCDMHGNVREWCEDHWHQNYEGAPTDGSVWLGGTERIRVVRGGSWNLYAKYCRAAYRNFVPENKAYRYSNIGFRVCCDAPTTLS